MKRKLEVNDKTYKAVIKKGKKCYTAVCLELNSFAIGATADSAFVNLKEECKQVIKKMKPLKESIKKHEAKNGKLDDFSKIA